MVIAVSNSALGTSQAQGQTSLCSVIQRVIDQKKKNLSQAIEDRSSKEWKMEAIWIGGDVFTTASLGVSVAKTILKTNSLAAASLVLGEVGGVLNIAVAWASLVTAVNASKLTESGEMADPRLALRCYFDAVCSLAIGVLMILVSSGFKAAFFSMHPYLLTSIFFISSLPLLVEVSDRVYNVLSANDLASKILDAPDLQKYVEEVEFAGLIGKEPQEVSKVLSAKLEMLQADMGVEAAIEVFQLMQIALDPNTELELIQDQKKIAEEKVNAWNRALYLRLGQQLLFALAFGVSLSASAGVITNPKYIDLASNGSEMLANAIPTYLDIFEPFKRNAPIVTPMVELEQ